MPAADEHTLLEAVTALHMHALCSDGALHLEYMDVERDGDREALHYLFKSPWMLDRTIGTHYEDWGTLSGAEAFERDRSAAAKVCMKMFKYIEIFERRGYGPNAQPLVGLRIKMEELFPQLIYMGRRLRFTGPVVRRYADPTLALRYPVGCEGPATTVLELRVLFLKMWVAFLERDLRSRDAMESFRIVTLELPGRCHFLDERYVLYMIQKVMAYSDDVL
ncbi:hypothetical protein AURDEDRAFT_177048 [Auricularia subglabra TFB-10046 SS5]|nr:hypothetical protein AURDEDRAFT_177048 [Auricularia subglabra TFB-10046 SS5]